MSFDLPAEGLLGFLEAELARQREVVAVEVARLAALEDLTAFVWSVQAGGGEGYVVESLEHLEQLISGDHVQVARLEDLVRRSAPTRRHQQ